MLGDRRLHITLARVWDSLSKWERVKLMYNLAQAGLHTPTKEEVEQLKVWQQYFLCIQDTSQCTVTLVAYVRINGGLCLLEHRPKLLHMRHYCM